MMIHKLETINLNSKEQYLIPNLNTFYSMSIFNALLAMIFTIHQFKWVKLINTNLVKLEFNILYLFFVKVAELLNMK